MFLKGKGFRQFHCREIYRNEIKQTLKLSQKTCAELASCFFSIGESLTSKVKRRPLSDGGSFLSDG